MNILAIFDKASRTRAFLHFREERIEAEILSGFDGVDINDFVVWLESNDPELRKEEDGVIWYDPVSKKDPDYFLAVMGTMKRKGFDVYPIEEYQKKLLRVLNGEEFDNVRQSALGDLLGISEEEMDEFLRELEEGMELIRQKNKKQ